MSEYAFIEDQVFLYGEDYVDSLINDGYVPVYVAEKGWRWTMPITANSPAIALSTATRSTR